MDTVRAATLIICTARLLTFTTVSVNTPRVFDRKWWTFRQAAVRACSLLFDPSTSSSAKKCRRRNVDVACITLALGELASCQMPRTTVMAADDNQQGRPLVGRRPSRAGYPIPGRAQSRLQHPPPNCLAALTWFRNLPNISGYPDCPAGSSCTVAAVRCRTHSGDLDGQAPGVIGGQWSPRRRHCRCSAIQLSGDRHQYREHGAGPCVR